MLKAYLNLPWEIHLELLGKRLTRVKLIKYFGNFLCGEEKQQHKWLLVIKEAIMINITKILTYPNQD